MAASGANLRYFCCRVSGASSWWDCDGALWRSCRAQKDVYPQYPADGRADVGHWSAANLRLDGHSRPVIVAADAYSSGAAIGGEVPGAWVFVAEHVPARRIGIACGTLTAGLTVGILLGSVVATIVNTSMTQQAVHDWGWRLPFLLGGAFGLVAMYLRRWLQETPIFLEMQQRKALAQVAR